MISILNRRAYNSPKSEVLSFLPAESTCEIKLIGGFTMGGVLTGSGSDNSGGSPSSAM